MIQLGRRGNLDLEKIKTKIRKKLKGVTLAHIFVNVWLKTEILDPQGKAVAQALHRQGLENISQVRQGKRFRIDFEGDVTQADIARVSKEVLSNPVIEEFEIEIKD